MFYMLPQTGSVVQAVMRPSFDKTDLCRCLYYERRNATVTRCYMMVINFVNAGMTLPRSAECRYLVYSEADFEVFHPRRGDTLHRWG